MEEFEAVYRRYFADVYRYVLALSRDAHTAEEVTQETFFKALTAIDSFRGQCPLRLWLCRIARNQYLTLCRERAKYAQSAAERGDSGIEEGFARQETARQLHRLVAECLTAREAEIIRLRYGLGGTIPLTQREVAASFGISRSYVSRIEKRALEKLHTLMEETATPMHRTAPQRQAAAHETKT